MYNAIDTFLQELASGDLITYSTRRGSYHSTYAAIITEIIDSGDNGPGRIKLKVKTYDPFVNYNRESGAFHGGTRKATLTQNSNIVRINRNTLPISISELLHL